MLNSKRKKQKARQTMAKDLNIYTSDLILTFEQTMKIMTIIDDLEKSFLEAQSVILADDELTSIQQEQLLCIEYNLQALREARREEFRSEVWHEKLKEFLTT